MMTKKQKKVLVRIGMTLIIYTGLMLGKSMQLIPGMDNFLGALLCYLILYLLIGWDVLYKAFRNILNGQVFDENFLMCIATFGAFGIGEYPEAVAVMLFYQIGEWFQGYAVGKSRQSITELMNICPEYANVEENGVLKKVDPSSVQVSDIIVVKAGERIPLDGTVTEGKSTIDTSALTGESVPRRVLTGSDVISGCVNQEGVLRVKVSKKFEDSTVSKILEMVEKASSKKAKVEKFITKFARYYTPIVVIGALLLAIVPPLFWGGVWGEWVRRACIFLVISCPCALVISVPLSFFGGIGAASKGGVLVKGSNFLEALSEMRTIVFDKTGTLTKGDFKVTDIRAETIAQDKLLETAALAECYSDHPIAQSIKEAYGKEIDPKRVKEGKEIAGHGIQVIVDEKEVLAGNIKLMKQMNIPVRERDSVGTVVYIASEKKYIGAIIIEDEIKLEAEKAFRGLHNEGIERTVMLTGDSKAVGEAVAKKLRISEVHTELLPGDKVEQIEKLLREKTGKDKIAFVGDGINDAPVLTRVDIGIAMGSMGSDAAIEAADVVLMDDNLTKIPFVIKVAKGTMKIAKQNIAFALGVKVLILILGAFGEANMWQAVFADVGVSVIAILNAMRALRIRE